MSLAKERAHHRPAGRRPSSPMPSERYLPPLELQRSLQESLAAGCAAVFCSACTSSTAAKATPVLPVSINWRAAHRRVRSQPAPACCGRLLVEETGIRYEGAPACPMPCRATIAEATLLPIASRLVAPGGALLISLPMWTDSRGASALAGAGDEDGHWRSPRSSRRRRWPSWSASWARSRAVAGFVLEAKIGERRHGRGCGAPRDQKLGRLVAPQAFLHREKWPGALFTRGAGRRPPDRASATCAACVREPARSTGVLFIAMQLVDGPTPGPTRP